MKFISEIKKEKINSDISIKIPIYHRTSISFFTGSEVYYMYRTYKSGIFSINELILTPIKPEIWHHIRKITLNAIDSPGIINAITSKLKDLKINVNIEEALTTQIGAIHTITLIIDISLYVKEHTNKYNPFDKVPQEAINEIEDQLKNLINPYTKLPIVFDNQVYIKELTFLESISNVPSNYAVSNINAVQFQTCANQKIKNNSGNIVLDQKIINHLNLKSDYFFYTIFSDTEDKYIKLTFFDPDQTVVFIDIFHEDIYGAIAQFTEIIYKNYGFNILASYSHQQMQKETAHWFALIDISNKKQDFFSETLDALKTCKYGEANIKKSVLDVFLIEANTSSIPDDAILRFGQNKLTKDREITSVYTAKQILLEKSLNDYGADNYVRSPKGFVKHYNLHETSSLKKLVSKILNDRKARRNDIFKRIVRWLVAITLPLIILGVSMEYVPKIHELVEELREHMEGMLVGAVTILLMFITHKITDTHKTMEVFTRLKLWK